MAVSINLQGHRGARGLAPENTLPGFVLALEHGMDTLELDVVLTRDQILVIHHDLATNPHLCQQTNGDRLLPTPIAHLMASDLTTLDCGSRPHPRFPRQASAPGASPLTLRRFFNSIATYEANHPRPRPVRFNVELKLPSKAPSSVLQATAETVVTELRRATVLHRATVQSFELRVLPLVAALEPTIELSALFKPTRWQLALLTMGLEANRSEIIEKALTLGVSTLSPHHRYINGSFVHRVHQRGLKVIPWTVNDPDRIRTLLSLGVDGLISDYPDLLKREYTRFQKGLSP